jgi:hypothetical protein
MDEQTKKLRQLRLTIILTSIVGLLSFFSMTITTFAWGVGDTTLLYLLLYPTFLLSTILVIAKVRLGYFLTFLTAFTYAILLTSEVGKYLIFNFHNNVLFWVLLLPYLTFLTLIPLTAIFLTANFKFAKTVKLTSIILALGLFISAANSTLAIGGVSSPLDSFVVAESSVLRTNFCTEKPAHRQSAKRWNNCGKRTQGVPGKVEWAMETFAEGKVPQKRRFGKKMFLEKRRLRQDFRFE